MRARAAIRAEADDHGRTRLVTMRSAPPLTLRRTGPSGSKEATVHLVGSAASPLGGDELQLTIELGPDTTLTLRTATASVALTGRDGESSLDVRAKLDAGAFLTYEPGPLIVTRGARHRIRALIEMADEARLRWREIIVLGRDNEPPGQLRVTTQADIGDLPLHRHELVIGDRPGWNGPAALGGAKMYGTLLVAGARLPHPVTASSARDDGVRWVRMPLEGPGMLATATDSRARPLDGVLDSIIAHGHPPTPSDPA